jgi:hypothetical protein
MPRLGSNHQRMGLRAARSGHRKVNLAATGRRHHAKPAVDLMDAKAAESGSGTVRASVGGRSNSPVCGRGDGSQTSRHGSRSGTGNRRRAIACNRRKTTSMATEDFGQKRMQVTVLATAEPTALVPGLDRPDPSKVLGRANRSEGKGGGGDGDDRLPAPPPRGPLPCRLPPRTPQGF